MSVSAALSLQPASRLSLDNFSLFYHHCSAASPPLPPPPLSKCLPALLLRLSAFAVLGGGTLQPVMNINPTLDRSSDLMKNGEAQEIPPLRSYLCLTMLTCFCPAWPINIVALVFSVLAKKSYDEQDYDGSMRLGRKALHMGIVSFLIGVVIITVYIIVHFTMHVV